MMYKMPPDFPEGAKRAITIHLIRLIKIAGLIRTTGEVLQVYDETTSYLPVDSPNVMAMLLDPHIEQKVNELYLNNPVYYTEEHLL